MTLSIEHCLLAPSGSVVLSSPLGNWWMEWCDRGVLATCATTARENNHFVPDWLSDAWNAVWNGEDVHLTLCTPRPLSPFFSRVYGAIIRLLPESGATATPQEIVQSCGLSGSVSSVVKALRQNPWPLFLPCHRVVTPSSQAQSGPLERISAQLRSYEQSLRQMSSGIADKFTSAKAWVLQSFFPSKESETPNE